MSNLGTNAAKVIGYAVLPRILPRLGRLSFKFPFVAFLMAQFFIALKMLPKDHMFASQQAYGSFGVIAVLASVANNIRWRWGNIDQNIIFVLFLAATVLLLLQIIGFLFFLVIQSAQASPMDIPAFFAISTAEDDISFILLDRIFGVPNFFNSSEDPENAAGITPFQQATQALFKFYSLVIMMIGGLIIIYFIFAVMGEAMHSGSPLGQRFATVFAPARLVIFLFLITPAAHGYSLGQYTVLAMAKWGSSVATNAWKTFNADMDNALKDVDSHLLVKPNADDISPLAKFMNLAQVCRAAHGHFASSAGTINPYLIKDGAHIEMPTNIQEAVDFYESGNVIIYFTSQAFVTDPAKKHLCGSLVMRVDNAESSIVQGIYSRYLSTLRDMWNDPQFTAYGRMFVFAANAAIRPSCPSGGVTCSTTGAQCAPSGGGGTNASWSDCNTMPGADLITCFRDEYQKRYNTAITQGITDSNIASDELLNFDMEEDIIKKGWAGAGIWYNKIASVNGDLVNISFKVPQPRKPPAIMTRIAEIRQASDAVTGGSDRFNVDTLVEDQRTLLQNDNYNIDLGRTLYEAHKLLNTDSMLDRFSISGNPFLDLFNLVIGTQGLQSLQTNRDLHPLAQLAALGRSLIDKAVFNVIGSVALGLGGGFILGQEENVHMGQAVSGVSGALMTLAMLGVGVGFLLYYIIPFLPFIYFFFAVATWISTIFEAMVAIPLWAVAHLRIDGNGLPGPAAMNGYVLLLEIFLRPIIVVMGLVASMAIFSALAIAFNDMYRDITQNLSGFPVGYIPECTVAGAEDVSAMRPGADSFFFLLIYAFIIYMMAMSAFKLIDLMPDTVMRWLGPQIKSFGEIIANPPTDNLISYGAISGSQIAGEVGDVMQKGSQTLGQSLGSAARQPPPTPTPRG